MKRIYIVRHGQSVGNRDNIMSGHTDHPLTDLGKAQAEATKQLLRDVPFDDVYSSDLQRAADTAEIIYGKPVPKDHQLSDLRERSYGELEGKPSHVRVKRDEALKAQLKDLSDEEKWHHKPGGDTESHHELSTRFFNALRELANNSNGKTILLVAHGGCVRTTLIKLGYATQNELPGGSFKNGGFIVLDYEDGSFSVEKVVGVDKANLTSE